MNPELQLAPEHKESRLNTSFKKILEYVREKITDSLDVVFKYEDPDILALELSLQESRNIGEAAEDFISNLIPHALKRPNKEYVHAHKHIQPDLTTLNFLKLARKSFSGSAYRTTKETALNVANMEHHSEVVEELIENQMPSETKRQQVFYQYQQDGGRNVIKECIVNELAMNEGKTEQNFAVSNMVIKDRITGVELNLDQLLPENYFFTPSHMEKVEMELDKTSNKVGQKRVPVDLKSYQGVRDSHNHFAAGYPIPRILYGNIAKKGGVLSTLHEVAHAWQSVYYNEEGKENFETFFREVTQNLELLAWSKEQLDQEADEDMKNLITRDFLQVYKQKLSNMGIEVDINAFTQTPERIQDTEVTLKSRLSDKEFIVKSERLYDFIRDYIREERDAWAHALRVIRFLRKRGLDLEPELQTIKDIQEIVDPCLGSYQQSLEDMIESSEKGLRFARQSHETPLAPHI